MMNDPPLSSVPRPAPEAAARAGPTWPTGRWPPPSTWPCRLGKPLLLEGEAGVGQTEVAKALSTTLGAQPDPAPVLRRNQRPPGPVRVGDFVARRESPCGEGCRPTTWPTPTSRVSDLFGEDFLVERPLLAAIRAGDPGRLLLVDELDRARRRVRQRFFWRVLSRSFAVEHIPELGPDRASAAAASRRPHGWPPAAAAEAGSPRRTGHSPATCRSARSSACMSPTRRSAATVEGPLVQGLAGVDSFVALEPDQVAPPAWWRAPWPPRSCRRRPRPPTAAACPSDTAR